MCGCMGRKVRGQPLVVFVTQVLSTLLFFLKLCFIFVAVCLMHVCGYTHATAHMRRSENNAQELVVSPL